ncbi:hypothetical protein A0H81_08584 [Grifola frondosa]|uniref:Uncharacterized protein n=1 Tax=Grifola frondosa TaxID=5627 RepID=A0A1C7M3Y7_GRIFR|nr:hypothetical protein A0H81_08584 [Grifola frondosa]
MQVYFLDVDRLPKFVLDDMDCLENHVALETLKRHTARLECFLMNIAMFFPDDIVRSAIAIIILARHQFSILSRPHQQNSARYIMGPWTARSMSRYLETLLLRLCSTWLWTYSEEGVYHRQVVSEAISNMHTSLSDFECPALDRFVDEPHPQHHYALPMPPIYRESDAVYSPLRMILHKLAPTHFAEPMVTSRDSAIVPSSRESDLLLGNLQLPSCTFQEASSYDEVPGEEDNAYCEEPVPRICYPQPPSPSSSRCRIPMSPSMFEMPRRNKRGHLDDLPRTLKRPKLTKGPERISHASASLACEPLTDPRDLSDVWGRGEHDMSSDDSSSTCSSSSSTLYCSSCYGQPTKLPPPYSPASLHSQPSGTPSTSHYASGSSAETANENVSAFRERETQNVLTYATTDNVPLHGGTTNLTSSLRRVSSRSSCGFSDCASDFSGGSELTTDSAMEDTDITRGAFSVADGSAYTEDGGPLEDVPRRASWLQTIISLLGIRRS